MPGPGPPSSSSCRTYRSCCPVHILHQQHISHVTCVHAAHRLTTLLTSIVAGLQKAVEEQKRILADVTHTYNWAQTATYETSRFRFPENEAEVVTLIKGHDKVRGAGALHSSSPLSQQEADGGIIISTRLLDKVIEIDEASMTVTCEAGCIAGVLFIALEEKGFALSNWGTVRTPPPNTMQRSPRRSARYRCQHKSETIMAPLPYIWMPSPSHFGHRSTTRRWLGRS